MLALDHNPTRLLWPVSDRATGGSGLGGRGLESGPSEFASHTLACFHRRGIVANEVCDENSGKHISCDV